MADTLLQTKLHIPSIRPELVSRPRLVELLNDCLKRKLTLISAPAGFGKTTLVSEWVNCFNPEENRSPINIKTAWLSVDESDNDPGRFLAYFVATLQVFDKNIGQKAQAVFQSQQQLLIDPIMLTLVNDISKYIGPASENGERDFVLILDDYHHIEEPAIHQIITYFLEHQSPNLHLVILTRIDPPLPLSKLRVRNQLLEFRGNQLHFTEKEVEEFLNELMDLDLSSDDIALLESRTEGWIAGLQLAAISMKNQKNRHEFIQTFSGDNRFVIDYLLDEVLLKQPEEVRRFVHRTAFLNRMCGSLCDSVVNFSNEEPPLDSQKLLEYLDRINLFVIPLDDQRIWYRYHHLFSEAVRSRFSKTDADLVPRLYSRASQWYEIEGEYDLALKHALAAEDFDRAARLVENHSLELLVRSNLTVLKKRLDSLPPELVLSRPELSVFQGWILLLIGKIEDVKRYVDNAEQFLSSKNGQKLSGRIEVLGHTNIIKSHLALKYGQLLDAIGYSEKALEYVEKGSPVHGHVAVIQGQAAYLEGELPTADQSFREAVQIAKDCDHMFMAVEAAIWLGHIKTLQGSLHQAERFYRDALQLAEVGENSLLPIAGSAHIGMALVERERNKLSAAEKLLMDSYDLCNLFGNLQSWHTAMAYVKKAQGKFDETIDNMQVADRLSKGSDVIFDHLKIDHGRVRLWFLSTGEMLEEARQWAESSDIQSTDEPTFLLKNEYTLLARVLLKQGKVEKANGLLDRLQENAEIEGRKGDLIEILVLQALALLKQESFDKAAKKLEKALSLAEPEGFIRIFLDEGPPIARLLRKMRVEERRIKSYIWSLLLLSEDKEPSPAPSQPLIEPLSNRELDVLRMIAEGFTNREIATRLFLSPNTVKVHARNIYQKLGINNRTQAVATARVLGLLPDE